MILASPSFEFGWRHNGDPEIAALEVDLTEHGLRNWVLPLTEARFIIAQDAEQRFRDEVDPDGVRWEPWAESYKKRAERENVGILRKQDSYHKAELGKSLYDAATDENSYIIQAS